MPEVTLPGGMVISGTADEIATILAATGNGPQPADAEQDDGEYGRGSRARGAAVNDRQAALAASYRATRAEHIDKPIEDVIPDDGDPRRRSPIPPGSGA